MCVSPIEIVNPTKDFRLNDKIMLTVPCGHCYECRNIHQAEFKVRVQEQMLYNDENGYYNCFFTLTYNEDHLPHLHFVREECEENEDLEVFVPSFSKKHVQTFVTSLKKYISRHYHTNKRINYFVASEYGGKKGRPHYHVFIGFPCECDPEDIYNKVKDLWQGHYLPNSVITDKYGYVYPPEFDGGYVDGEKQFPFLVENVYCCSKYVSKYITKDYSYFENNKLVQQCLSDIRFLKNSDSIEDNVLSQTLKDAIFDSLPFHFCSKNFGACILDKLKSDDVKATIDNVLKGVPYLKQNGKMGTYSVPSYILRKLCYDITYVVENGKRYVRYDLNDYGKYYKLSVFDSQFKKIKQDLLNSFTALHLTNSLPLEYRDFTDFDLLALYRISYQGRLCPYFYLENSFQFDYDAINDLYLYGQREEYFFNYHSIDHLFAFANQMKIFEPKKRFGKQLKKKEVLTLSEISYNNIRLFRSFDRLLDILDKYILEKRHEDSIIRQAEFNRIQNLIHSRLCLEKFNQ